MQSAPVSSYILQVRLKSHMDKIDKIIFTGSLPPIQSAILLDGMGDGARIRIDISRQYTNEILKLQSLAVQCFKVTIEPEGKNVSW